MKKEYTIHGMSCTGCLEKVTETLNSLNGISAEVHLETNTATVTSTDSVNINEINLALQKVGNYLMEDPDIPLKSFVHAKDRISPSSVYYCPMECEGEKVYFEQGKRCSVCNMFLVPIEDKPTDNINASTTLQNKPKIKEGDYYCPMFCEGNKTYDKNSGCPICGMDLVQMNAGSDKENTTDSLVLLRKKLWVSILFTIPLILLSMGNMWFDFTFSDKIQQFLQLILVLPVLFFSGWFLLKRGWQSFFNGHLNMFSLIAIGVFASFIFSLFSLFFSELIPDAAKDHSEVPLYFESVATIITLVVLGQYLEGLAHKKTGNAINALLSLAPETANLVENETETLIPLEEVKVNDILKIKPGEKIPVDGKIIEGSTQVDESMITGEPLPILKQVNDPLIAGTLNGNKSVLMKVEKIGEDTLLSKIIQLVKEASRSKTPTQSWADKVISYFVPTIIAVAILTFFLWFIFGPQDQNLLFAFVNAVAVLVVACPCAMGLAIPMSIMVGIGKGAKNGILIKNATALEKMSKVEVVVLDKTGTLTEGKPKLIKIKTVSKNTENELIDIVTSLNTHSDHPLSQAINNASFANSKTKKVTHFEEIIGKGIVGCLEEKKYFIGNQDLLSFANISIEEELLLEIENLRNQAYTISFLSDEKELLGYLVFQDPLKTNAKHTIEAIQQQNIEVILLSGDHTLTVTQICKTLGITDFKGNCSPEDKLNWIKKLKKENKTVAMIGDGINDAPALAMADIGIAMGTGSAAAIESAEITLLKGQLDGILQTKILSEKMLKNSKENLFFAFIYNVLGVPLAAGILYPFLGILLSPMVAAAAMSFSSLSVILNSLRLNNVKLNIEKNRFYDRTKL